MLHLAAKSFSFINSWTPDEFYCKKTKQKNKRTLLHGIKSVCNKFSRNLDKIASFTIRQPNKGVRQFILCLLFEKHFFVPLEMFVLTHHYNHWSKESVITPHPIQTVWFTTRKFAVRLLPKGKLISMQQWFPAFQYLNDSLLSFC